MVDETDKLRDYLKRATVDLRKARRRVTELEDRANEPIAIVGMACRYPGGVSSAEDLWRLVIEGGDAIGEFPDDRGWDVESLFDPDPDRAGTSSVCRGGFLTDPAGFDAEFFGISPREALAMDPQQRLLLEAAWESLEHANIDPLSLRGSKTAVFAARNYHEYGSPLREAPESVSGHLVTGVVSSVASGRIAYVLGLEGPAVTVDTACSSSLVTLHLAAQSLRAGDCDLALAGGATVISSPGMFVEFSRQRGLSVDGRCRAFSEQADGMGMAEGVGLLVVERLSDARRLGHRVLAVVAGSAVNSDGASNGLSAPNGPSQQRVIRAALASAGLGVDGVDVVEGHGTGTRLGDPIEAQALLATYGRGRAVGAEPLWLGSVKSNVGHSQAAAGVAGVIKMVQALRYGVLPRTLHVDAPTPEVDWSAGGVELLTESRAWPVVGRPRRAGVSAFGISGTNAHVILEQAPEFEPSTDAGPSTEIETAGVVDSNVVSVVVSGRSWAGLAGTAGRLAGRVRECADASELSAVAGGLVSARAVLERRAVVVGSDPVGIADGLDRLADSGAEGASAGGVVQVGDAAWLVTADPVPADTHAGSGSGVVLVFPGQGGQWVGMVAGLVDCCPVFAARLAECVAVLEPLMGIDVWALLTSTDPAEIDGWGVEVVQPVLWAVMVSLAGVWQAAGVEVSGVVGHSQGEIAAAVVAGGLSLADGAKVVVLRAGLIAQRLAGQGGMVSVALPAEQVSADLVEWGIAGTTNPEDAHNREDRDGDGANTDTAGGGVWVAVVNGRSATVVSGGVAGLETAIHKWEGRGVRVRRVAVDYASHSGHVQALEAELLELLAAITPVSCGIAVFSSVTGDLIDTADMTAAYWFDNLRQPVQFQRAVQTAIGHGHTRFLEVSPHPVLVPAITDTLEAANTTGWVGHTLRRDHGGAEQLLTALAQHWTNTPTPTPATWATPQTQSQEHVELPTYAFHHQHYWLNPTTTSNPTTLGLNPTTHPLLQAHLQLPDHTTIHTGTLSTTSHPWLADHAVNTTTILPGTAYLDLALTIAHDTNTTLHELTLHQPLTLTTTPTTLHLTTTPPQPGHTHHTLTIHTQTTPTQPWQHHATAHLTPHQPTTPPPTPTTTWPPTNAVSVPVDSLYEQLAELGLQYGPAFRGLHRAWRHEGDILAEVSLPDSVSVDGYLIHPALLDAAMHGVGLGGLFGDAAGDGLDQARLPFSWNGIRLYATGARALRVRLSKAGPEAISILVTDPTGAPVAEIDSLVARPLASTQVGGTAVNDSLYRLDWAALEVSQASQTGRWVVLGPAGQQLADQLQDQRIQAEFAEKISTITDRPELLILPIPVPDESAELAGEVHRTARDTLSLVQSVLAEESLAGSRLLVLTRNAVAPTAAPDRAGLIQAPIWGLLRSAQTEHPGRIVLIDLDGVPDGQLIAAALATGEEQLAVREGTFSVPRLVKRAASEPVIEDWDPAGTVLITGGTGTLGGLLAGHLVRTRDVRQLVLVSRSGAEASGAAELVAELEGLGATVTVAAADATDRAAMAAVIEAIDQRHPLTAVLQLAGVVDDGPLETLTANQLDRVLAAKVDAAIVLDELTRALPLAGFVLFSSAAAVLGGAGQAPYAAANAFLDALATDRRLAGLPGLALGWGFWQQRSGLTRHLAATDLARMKRSGVTAMSNSDALAMFDRALTAGDPVLAPVQFCFAALRERQSIPPVLRALVRPATRRAATSIAEQDGLRARLAALPADARQPSLVELVREQAATVLGHAGSDRMAANRAFRDLGFDSLTAVELRNRIAAASGLRLPASLVFDYPNPGVLADFLLDKLGLSDAPKTQPDLPMTASDDDPIAIVSMACRFPGNVRTPEDLWRLVSDGESAIGDFPTDRGWDRSRLYDADPDRPGTSYVWRGGFVVGAAEFDAGLFGISPREALAMDPQQRLLLEVSWELLERAGLDPLSLRGSRTGVFAGVMYHDYASRVSDVSAEIEPYLGNGSAGSIASGRVAYTFGFEGPAVTVDTACSSSLVALHLAVQSLRSGESDLALAGGVTVMSTPTTFVEFSRQRGLAPDGLVKSYASAADGTALSEGIGLLLVERLSRARRLGHPVVGLVRGSAVNQDGASNGLTAPNGPSQQRVIVGALVDAGLGVVDVDVVEGHGTATRLGDPIEAQALLATYGQGRSGVGPLLLGSVKSNIGHAQAAAGVAGVIKVVQGMRHGVVPASLHVDVPSGEVDWCSGAVELVTQARAWPERGGPRRAGVSSFGVSGTNAHVIIEQAPAEDVESVVVEPEPVLMPFVLSGHTESALAARAVELADFVRDRPGTSPVEVARALVTDRTQFEHRAVLVSEPAELEKGLRSLGGSRPVAELVTGSVVAGGVGFVFSGQGCQRLGMGRGLVSRFPVFAQAWGGVCGVVDGLVGGSLEGVVWGGDGGVVDETRWAQVGLFAFEVALFRLVESWGVVPGFVLGHSVGEVAAAHVAGLLSLEDAVGLVVERGRLMQELAVGGVMVSVRGDVSVVLSVVEGVGGVWVAAVNGPESVVLSGVQGVVGGVVDRLVGLGLSCRRLRVSHGFHSGLMDPMLGEFGAGLSGLVVGEARFGVVSGVAGRLVGSGECGAGYWVRHAREGVRFADGVGVLREQGVGVFVEVGPAAVLSPMVAECLAAEAEGAAGSVVVPLVRAGTDEAGSVLAGAGRLWAAGVQVDWAATMPVTKAARVRRVELPTYPFQRQRYWLDATTSSSGSPHAHGLTDTHHPLLNAALAVAGGEGLVLTGRVALGEQPWLADHAVHDRVLLPGTALLDLALAAARAAGCDRVDELTLGAALVLPEQGAVQLQVVLDDPAADGARPIRIYARPEAAADEVAESDIVAWTQHAAGTLSSAEDPRAENTPADWPPAGDPVEVADLNARLSAAGFEYGPAFQGIRALWQRDGEVSAEVELTGPAGNFGIHPALLDAALHPMAMLLAPADGPVLPFNWQGVRLHRSGARALRVTLRAAGSDGVQVLATDEQGRPVLTAEALTVRAISADQLPAATPRRTGALYRLSWLEVGPEPVRNRRIALVGRGADADYPDLDALFAGAATIPDLVAVRLDGSASSSPTAAQQLCADTVALVQRWLAEQRCESSRLVLVSRGAVLARPGDEIDPALAAVWGLVRCAQAEHPDRISLIDLDGELAGLDALDNPREPQLAIRGNAVLAPRLRDAELPPAEAPAPNPAGTVLITGGTGALGAAVARQLAGRPGVEELLLISRRGPQAPGAPELVEELQARGARVRVAAVDAADRAALAGLIDEIPAERPLTMVLHAAGVLSDAVFDAVTDEQLAAVFAAKVIAAANLHELTRRLPLSAFVLFSSFAGLTGSAGQASYGAANAYLDALAEQRRAAGLPGLSLAWGWWEQEAGMTGQLSTADRARLARSHVRALSTDSALALLDTALAAGTDAVLAPVWLDLARLATVAEPAAMLRGLVPPAAASRPVSQERSLTDRLAELAGPQRSAAVLDFVRCEVGLVLGFADPAGVDVGKQFSELGFDSLMAVELRNRLRSGSGTELPATLVFDYPSPAEVAGRLASLLDVAEADPATALLGDLERIEQALSELDEASSKDRSRITLKLRSLMAGWQNGGTTATSNEPKVELHSATDDDLFSLVEDLGRS